MVTSQKKHSFFCWANRLFIFIKALAFININKSISDYNKSKGIKLNYIKNNSKIPSDYDLDFFAYNNDYDIYGNEIVKELLYEGSQKRFIYWSPKIQK